MRHTTPRTARVTVIVVALAAATAATGCGGDDEAAEPVAEALAADAEAAAASPEYGLVTAEQAAELAASGVTVLDVRTPEEYAEGHIEGARLIDFYSATFADQVAALDPGQEYLVYCRSGNRSGQAVGLMQELGIDRVWDLDGGVIAYSSAGLPLVR